MAQEVLFGDPFEFSVIAEEIPYGPDNVTTAAQVFLYTLVFDFCTPLRFIDFLFNENDTVISSVPVRNGFGYLHCTSLMRV